MVTADMNYDKVELLVDSLETIRQRSCGGMNSITLPATEQPVDGTVASEKKEMKR